MTISTELSTGEALVGLLEAYGVDTVFGIPGVHNVELYRALPRSRIRHILVRHEQGAGFAADGYARATGKAGVCFTISGPGLTNIMTPLGQAWSDSSRLLVISTALDIRDAAQGRGRLHEMLDQRGAAATVTTLNMRAYTPQDVRDCVARAFANFAGHRPRPAYLELPLDLLKEPAGDGWTARPLPQPPLAPQAMIDAAIAKLATASNPVIILGGGALHAGAAALAIAEKLQAPILTTTAGKGAVRADHPLCLGYRLMRENCWRFLDQADAILCAGSELSETDFWASGVLLDHDLIRIDIDPDTLAGPHTAEIPILGEAKHALEAIAAGLSAKRKSAPPKAIDLGQPDAGRAMLEKVLAAIRESLPEDAIVCSDMTQIAYAANEVFPVYRPRTWIEPVGFATLGFALPAAVGAKLGAGRAPVAVLVGDYGLQYTVSELGTAAENGLPLIVLVWNNERLGAIHDDMVHKAIQPNAVTLTNPDFQGLARAFGCLAEKPASLAALKTAIAAALTASKPTVIEMTERMAGL